VAFYCVLTVTVRAFHMEFVVDKMAVGKGFLSKYGYSSIYAIVVLKKIK
jgi:hypothetical protein